MHFAGTLKLFFFGVTLSILSGCSAPQTRQMLHPGSGLPVQASIDNVPFYAQDENYCGPASLAMMLSWAGIPSTQQNIGEQIFTPGREGTLPNDIIAGARRNGALAIPVTTLPDLLSEVAAGNPVLVFQNLGLGLWPKWHFAVVTGYDLSNEQLILHSGLESERVHNLNAFERTWQRAGYWAVTITSPDRLPARASELMALEAAAGLERISLFDRALTAYRAIATRWPRSLIARMGLGNTFYKMGHFPEAAIAFLDVIRLDSNYAAAWHNLANSLSGQGLHDEALVAAHKAVLLDSDNKHYRNTLAEMMAKQPLPNLQNLAF